MDVEYTSLINTDITVKKLKTRGVCGHCKRQGYERKIIPYCTGNINACYNCEHVFPLDKVSDCIICHQRKICNCNSHKFVSETCRIICCRCVNKVDPVKICASYRFRKAPPSPVTSYLVLARPGRLNEECAKRYKCRKCNCDFDVSDKDKSIYFTLQRWFCSKKVCQAKCAEYYVHSDDSLDLCFAPVESSFTT